MERFHFYDRQQEMMPITTAQILWTTIKRPTPAMCLQKIQTQTQTQLIETL